MDKSIKLPNSLKKSKTKSNEHVCKTEEKKVVKKKDSQYTTPIFSADANEENLKEGVDCANDADFKDKVKKINRELMK